MAVIENPPVDGPNNNGIDDVGAILPPQHSKSNATVKNKKDQDLLAAVILPPHLQTAALSALKAIGFMKDDVILVPEHIPGELNLPTTPLLVFFNSRSGGRMGPTLESVLNKLIGPAQVFDLSKINPVKALSTVIQSFQEVGDSAAQHCLQNLRILVAGGDGTVGWMLSSVATLEADIAPPVGVIPLGTGNDLSRSFGWGSGFTSATKKSVRQRLLDVASAQVTKLDGWHIVVSPPGGTDLNSLKKLLPHAMQPYVPPPKQDVAEVSESSNAFVASFYNYFSIGMDAQIAQGFHHLRESKPWLARGGAVNKMIYSSFGCTQGWFCASCSPHPQRKSVSGVATIYIKKLAASDWEELVLSHRFRAVIILNLQSYAGGRNLWGTPTKKQSESGWAAPRVDDGLLEIVGLHDGWHTMLAMGGVSNAKHLAQAHAIKLELRGNQTKKAFMQLDGEPWRQPLKDPREPTFVEISPAPTKSVLLANDGAQVLKKSS